MAIFLPNATADDANKTDVDALHAATDEIAANMQQIVDLVRNPLYWTLVRLKLPRVDAKTTTPVDITDLLASNGYEPLFVPGGIARALGEERVTTHADGTTSTELATVPQAVGQAVMMTTLEMHERGFEAAAVAVLCYVRARRHRAGAHRHHGVQSPVWAAHSQARAAGAGAETDADLTPPQFLYSMNVTNDSVLKEAKSAREHFGDDDN